MIKNISDFIARSSFGRAIEGLHVTPDAYVATDSYKLIKIPATTGASEPYTVKLPAKVKTFDTITSDGTITYKDATYHGEVIADAYPKYETIIPSGDPLASVTLSADHLAQICKAYTDGKLSQLTLSIHGDHKPVTFTNSAGMFAMLMPIAKK
jgi:hypothetical protein